MIRVLLTCVLTLALLAPAHAEVDTLRLGAQRGLTYLPFAIMRHEKLIEKHAEAAGIAKLTVESSYFAGSSQMNDALLAEQIDIAATGIPTFLVLWTKGRGKLAIKGLASYGSMPIALITRNPNVRKLEDFTDQDRIAVPAAKTSLQAIFMAMAAERMWGTDKAGRFDSLQVTRGHPDAYAALMGNTEINSHFAIPPYLQLALKRPDIHIVATSEDMVGSKVSNGTIYLQTRFQDANPKLVAAYYAALKEAVAIINADPMRAALAYLAISNEKTAAADIVAMIQIPGTLWDVAPHGTVRLAGFLRRIGMIASEPKDWKELYFPLVHDEPGS